MEQKKTIDFHKTNEITGEHKTLLEVSTFRFLLFLRRLQDVQQFLINYIWLNQKINPGKQKKHHCYLFDIDNENITQEDILKVRGGKKLRLSKSLPLLEFTKELELNGSDILHNRNEGIFLVCRFKRGCWLFEGMIFKIPLLKGNYFITKKVFNLTSKLTLIAIYNLSGQINFDNKEAVLSVLRELLSSKYEYLFIAKS